jgi:hypothetical protein
MRAVNFLSCKNEVAKRLAQQGGNLLELPIVVLRDDPRMRGNSSGANTEICHEGLTQSQNIKPPASLDAQFKGLSVRCKRAGWAL